MSKPTASLSLDLDNLWSYMKTHGSAGWEKFPTYLPKLLPPVLEWLERNNQQITFFVVGQDAAMEENREALGQIVAAGHEIGNHSFHHEPWMQYNSESALVEELSQAEEAIGLATGSKPQGFRGPGFCSSPALLSALRKLGYQYDASILPSLLGPLARLYYMWGTKLPSEDKKNRNELFGRLSDGFRPLKPYEWKTPYGKILEIPVSTIPVLRVPFHLSYILWLSSFSKAIALQYMRFAFMMCRLRGVQPSFLLHPLDFLSGEDAPELRFFPGMDLTHEHKREMAEHFIEAYQKSFEVVPLAEHVRRIYAEGDLKTKELAFSERQAEASEVRV